MYLTVQQKDDFIIRVVFRLFHAFKNMNTSNQLEQKSCYMVLLILHMGLGFYGAEWGAMIILLS